MNEDLIPEQAALRSRLSKNLKKLRTAQKISQEGLGSLAGFHRTYVSQVERMVTNPTVDNIALLAKALGIDPAELFAKVEESVDAPDAGADPTKKSKRATPGI